MKIDYKYFIDSVHNPQIKAIKKLALSKYRNQEQLFIAEGIRTIETITEKFPPIELFITEAAREKISLTRIQKSRITVVSDSVMKCISNCSTPSGLLGLFKIPKPTHLQPPGLICDGVSDPGNLGSLIRSAAAFGCKTVVCNGGVDPWSPKVIQASAGTIAHITIIQMKPEEFLKEKKNSILIALSSHATQVIKPEPLGQGFLVVGSEGHGISEGYLTIADKHLRIPLEENVESLNVAIAGSIALYITHQKQKTL